MHPPHFTDQLEKFIQSALAEDIGSGDISALGAVPKNTQGKASLLVKDNGIIAGLEVAEKIFRHLDPSIHLEFFKKDGDRVGSGDVAFFVRGPARPILSGERVVLNCLQRMSGIATHTRRLCELIEGTHAKLMDTRKTTPNFRLLEKWAVAIGGGLNHRMGLYDMVMIKDNHADLVGGIRPAIENIRKYFKETGKEFPVEVETRTLEEVKVAMEAGVDVIMLDNMPVEQIRKAVGMVGGKCKTEASGGITEKNLRLIAETGVDFISVGALTHSVKSLDLSLKVQVA